MSHPVTTPLASTARPRLLMIDNNQGDLELVRIAFDEAKIGVDLTCADSGHAGQEALARVAQGQAAPYRLTLLDLNMPGRNGHDVLRWARAPGSPARSAPWPLTSSSSTHDRRTCLSEGATEVLVKPPTFSGLIALVEGLRSYLFPVHSATSPAPASSQSSGALSIEGGSASGEPVSSRP